MKGIVWVTIAALVVFVTARALSAETTEPVASGGYGGTVAAAPEKAGGEAAAEAPGPFGGSVSRVAATEKAEEPAAKPSGGFGRGTGSFAGGAAATTRTAPTRGRSMGAAMYSAERPATVDAPGRTMGLGGLGTPAAKPVKRGDQFRLRERRGAATYGPFAMRDGEVIVIGDKSYTIELVEVQKTDEQEQLERKLRHTMLPEMPFEGAKLMEIVDYLSREGDVNIVVSNVVREGLDSTITLRLRNVPLYDAIRYVTEVCDIRFRIDDHAVFISE